MSTETNFSYPGPDTGMGSGLVDKIGGDELITEAGYLNLDMVDPELVTITNTPPVIGRKSKVNGRLTRDIVD